MNTAEMYLQAIQSGHVYETIPESETDFILYYQKDKKLFDEEGIACGPEVWNYFDDLMKEQWKQSNVLTKSEAEAKFNIKIVGD